MKKIFYLPLLFFAFFACEQDEINVANRVSFESETIAARVPHNEVNYEQVVAVYASVVSGSDRVFQLVVDQEGTTLPSNLYTLPATVTIPANSSKGEFTMLLTDTEDLGFTAKTIALNLASDSADYLGSATVSVTELCLDTLVKYELRLDQYPDETTWELYNLSSGAPVLIYSGGPYDNDVNGTKTFEFCLASGQYGLVVYDAWGDGIANGGYTVSVGTTVIASGPVSGFQAVATFTIQ